MSPAHTLRKKLHLARLVRCRKGQVIFSQGREAQGALYLLDSGRVKLSLLADDGDERVIAYAGEGAILGESSLFGDGGYLVTAEAITDCRVGVFEREAVAAAIRENPELALDLLEVLVGKLRLTVKLVEEMSFLGAKERVARTIARLAASGNQPGLFGSAAPADRPKLVPVTHEELASLAGTSRVTVSHALAEFSRKGAIYRKRRRVVVRDLDLLVRAGK